jgi:hypothetical protein
MGRRFSTLRERTPSWKPHARCAAPTSGLSPARAAAGSASRARHGHLCFANTGCKDRLYGRPKPGAHRIGRTLVTVRLQRQVVDYALRRRSLLAEVYSGRTGVTEVCDANPYLLRAAKYHGKTSSVMCPICRKEQLTLVSWVFGDHLGPVSGSARSAEELVMLATRFAEFSVHVVEVCRTCSWNHLVKSYVMGALPAPKGTPRQRTTRARTASE